MPLRAKSRGKYVSVDWASVGRRIREIRGFDMTPDRKHGNPVRTGNAEQDS